MSYILEHTVLGFCWWDIPGLIVFIGVAVYFFLKNRKSKEEEKDLEDQLSDLYADAAVEAEKNM